MSLYDDAAVALIAEGAAGKDGVLYNIKPELEVHAEELTTNGDFATPGTATESSWSLGWATSGGSEGDTVISGGKLTLTNAGAEDRADAYMTDGSSAFFDLIDDETYYVTYNVTDNSDGAASILKVYAGSSNSYDVSADLGPQSVLVTQSGADNSLIFQMKSTDASITISNISVKRVKQASKDFTFTRGSNLTATRVGPDGLIEKGRENLITYSNDFSEWGVNTDVYNTPTTGHTGYDGSTNAWLIDRISTDNSYVGIPNNPKLSYTGVFTWSIYAKNESGVDNAILMYTEVGQARFDLTGDGAVLNDSSVIESNIEKIESSGWFRCSFTANGTINADSNGTPRFRVEDLSNNNAVGKIYVQDSQLEAGLVATEYIDSPGGTTGEAGIFEDSPRFDYLDVTCPHLLMEPQRRNYFAFSEYAAGNTNVTATVTQNHAVSPEGLQNAFRIQHPSGTSFLRVNTSNVDITSLGDTFTFSVFVKKASSAVSTFGGFGINFFGTSAKVAYVIFDEYNGTATKSDAVGNMVVHPVENHGDYWRFSASYTDTGSNTAVEGILYAMISTNGSAVTVSAGGSKDYTAYGLQFEEGAFPTSYIPNHGTSAGVTRDYDIAETIDVSDYMDGKDFTFFVDLADNPSLIRDGSTTGIRFASENNSNIGGFRFYRTGSASARTQIYWSDRDDDNVPGSHQIDNAGRTKVIVRRVARTGEFTVFYDGDQQYQKFNTDFDDFVKLTIDGEKQTIFLNSLIIFDRALTDDECDSLTTV